ncbi:MAG: hypothetical protein IJP98_02310 [Clostridia bacterium]|nr:hypothetical protein [Clostridia bacterium]
MDEEKTTLDQEVNDAGEETVETENDDLDFEQEDYSDEDDGWEDDDWDDEPDEEGAEKPTEEQFTVKYNGEEKQLTREELITAAQKGLNYDKVKARLDSVEQGSVYRAMKAGAEKAGMSVEDYASYLLESNAADDQMEAERTIREKYPNAPADMIKEMAKLQTASSAEAARTSEQTAEQKAWAEALREYPDMKPDEIPESVQNAVKAGATPLQALKDHEISTLKEKIRTLEADRKNKENKAASTGSVTGRGGHSDPFLEGWNS